MKRFYKYLLAGAGIMLVVQALATNISMACWGGAHQTETPDCMK
ncbi:AgrD family cyclic lactone autoinducer peptide [Wukongibacter sp. M2B1]